MKLKAWRVNKGITAEEAAKIAGVSVKTISLWENDPERLKGANLWSIIKLCDAYGITIVNLEL